MISLKHGDKYLDIQKGSISFEVKNPLFYQNSIPGMISFPFNLAGESKVNNASFRYARLPGVTDPATTLKNIQLYINKIMWKIGRIDLLGGTKDYQVNFISDAGDLATAFSNTKLTELDLGSDVLDYSVVNDVYPVYNYALFPVKNIDFYGDKNPDFKGYSNYYHNGQFLANTVTNDYNLVPFFYIPFVLKKIFDAYGWELSGAWLEDPDIRRLALYNNYALDKQNAGGINVYETTITYARHLPDITIGSFLVELKNMFGLGFFFDVKQKKVIIRSWQEVLANQFYRNVMAKAGEIKNWNANRYLGITFRQEFTDDDLVDELSTAWAEFRQDEGEEKITTAFAPLFERSETDPINARSWQIPQIRQPGSSPLFDRNDSGLRLMFYAGLENDSLGNPYPAAHDFYGNTSLRWQGAAGLVNRYFSNYVAFKRLTRYEVRDIRFNTADMLSIDVCDKLYIDYQLYLVESATFTINENGLKPAKVKLWLCPP